MPTQLWSCDICRARYDTRAAAEKCEAQGVGGDDLPPRGLIVTESVTLGFRDDPGGCHLGPNRGDRFVGVATGESRRITAHCVSAMWWWFRGNGCGDDPCGDGHPGRAGVVGPWRKCGDTFLEAPSTQRAIAACREMGIDPLIVRGGEIVRLDDVERSA